MWTQEVDMISFALTVFLGLAVLIGAAGVYGILEKIHDTLGLILVEMRSQRKPFAVINRNEGAGK